MNGAIFSRGHSSRFEVIDHEDTSSGRRTGKVIESKSFVFVKC